MDKNQVKKKSQGKSVSVYSFASAFADHNFIEAAGKLQVRLGSARTNAPNARPSLLAPLEL
jgi:hypothetical protein